MTEGWSKTDDVETFLSKVFSSLFRNASVSHDINVKMCVVEASMLCKDVIATIDINMDYRISIN